MLTRITLALAPMFALAAQAPVVQVPAFPNVSCPIMGKPISQKLFVDTPKGRIWVCCKACNQDVLADPTAAHAASFPKIETVENTICPVSGEAIPKEAPRVVLQGFDFAVSKKEHVEKAIASSQIVLAKLREPKLVDVGNRTCPISGEPVSANAFAVVDGAIVRLAREKLVEDVRKEPVKVLAKAREIAAKQKAPGDAVPPPKKAG